MPQNSSGSGGSTPARGPTLEEFLVACQKSLARTATSSAEAGKADSEFAQGERPVYVIDSLELDLSVGMRLSPDEDVLSAESVHLDFDAPHEQRSRIKFRVETRPQELLAGAKLQLANLDPLGEELPVVRLRVWLVDDRGMPVPNHPVAIHFARAGDKNLRPKERIAAQTDVVGRVDFYLETGKAQGNLKVIGVRKRFTVHVKGGARGKAPDEFYVWATCPRSPGWEKVVEPAAPRPPGDVPRDTLGRPVELSTELIRLRLEEHA